jgi:Beta-lactamase
MNAPRLQHGFTTGRQGWLIIAVAVGVVLSTQVAGAKACHRETPLPADVRLSAPGPEVPGGVARFAGAWSGVQVGPGDSAPICETLVVEEVLPNGYAWVIFSIGTSPALGVRPPWFVRAIGRIVDGELRVQLPLPNRPILTYQVVGETLQGTSGGVYSRDSDTSLTRVADARQVGCGQSLPRATGPRDRLTAAELLAANPGIGLVHNDYFMPVGPSVPALHAFKGTLTIRPSSMSTAKHGCPDLNLLLPGFTVAFFSQGEHLVPAVSDIVHPPAIIVSPGRVWSEPGDGGMSRASFPFLVTNFDESHNGLATFVYDDTQVSALRWQVVQENVPSRDKYDGWGQAPMTYTPEPIAHEEALRLRFAAALQQQTPIRLWSALPVPSGMASLEDFDGDTAPDDLKASGLIVDGVLYLRGCETRAGPYPYCRQMRHGVFSVTKSMGAAVALLRLAQRYGDEVFALKIKDYVPVTAAHDGWERVTFADALNMATGIGDNWPQREPNQPFADDGRKWGAWVNARTTKDKLEVSFSSGKYPWGPGEVLRYINMHTFVLAAAMDSFLKRQTGPDTHLWDMVLNDVFRPIGIFQAPTLHTQEADGGRGIPYLMIGSYPTIDDIAHLANLLQHGGRHAGQQLLSAPKLAEALYKTAAMGFPTGETNRFGEARYHLSFWSVPYRTADGCFFQIPYMGGWGGSVVVLLPNGITAFRVADGNRYDVDTMVRAGEALRPFPCPAGSGEAPPPRERQPLTASDLRAELPGHTFYGDSFRPSLSLLRGQMNMYVSADGAVFDTFKAEPDGGPWHDVGRWRITPEGQYCVRWHVYNDRRERCFAISREGETFEFFPQGRFGKEIFRRVPGNPEGY